MFWFIALLVFTFGKTDSAIFFAILAVAEEISNKVGGNNK